MKWKKICKDSCVAPLKLQFWQYCIQTLWNQQKLLHWKCNKIVTARLLDHESKTYCEMELRIAFIICFFCANVENFTTEVHLTKYNRLLYNVLLFFCMTLYWIIYEFLKLSNITWVNGAVFAQSKKREKQKLRHFGKVAVPCRVQHNRKFTFFVITFLLRCRTFVLYFQFVVSY